MSTCEYTFKGKPVGEGTFGIVSVVEKDGKKYAFKRIKGEEKIPSNFYDPVELDIMFRLKSPYLMQGVDITVEGECHSTDIGIVTEYLDGDVEKNLKKLTYPEKKRMLYDIALGLKCLHDNNYIHLDIKIANVMYRKSPKLQGVLIDYGLASYTPNGIDVGITTNQKRSSFLYSSPEAAKSNSKKMSHYNGKDDIWSLGIAFCEMFSNIDDIFEGIELSNKLNRTDYKTLYSYISKYMSTDNIDSLLDDVVFRKLKIDIVEENNFKKLLKNMLKVDKNSRFNINEVVNDKFFKEFNEKDYCFSKKPNNYSLENVKTEYFKGVLDIMDICKDEIPKETLNILFMAIDIYLRVLSQASKEQLSMIEDLPWMCVLIANKYFYWSEMHIEFNNNIIFHIKEENLIYKIIKGSIREERYFDHCRTVTDAQNVLDFFLQDNMKNIRDYLSYDGANFVKAHGVDPDKSFRTKYIKSAKIGDLLFS